MRRLPNAEMGNMPVVDVGMRKVRVKRLLSEGGYAHVYKVSAAHDEFFRDPLLPSVVSVVRHFSCCFLCSNKQQQQLVVVRR